MLKLVFQPIAENAIIHNIQEVSPLKIEISGRKENDCIVFCIRDNGLGMEEEQVVNLLEKPSESKKNIFRGIGVHNVQQRLKMKYGEEYGLSIESEKGKGTAVEIRFPAEKAEKDGREEAGNRQEKTEEKAYVQSDNRR